MEVSREDLTQHFENLSDEELLQHLRSGTLTPLAIEVARGILRSRGVDPLSFPGAADSTVESAVGLDGEGLDLVTVSVEWDPLKANLLRALLESHGVFVYIWGEHLATYRANDLTTSLHFPVESIHPLPGGFVCARHPGSGCSISHSRPSSSHSAKPRPANILSPKLPAPDPLAISE